MPDSATNCETPAYTVVAPERCAKASALALEREHTPETRAPGMNFRTSANSPQAHPLPMIPQLISGCFEVPR